MGTVFDRPIKYPRSAYGSFVVAAGSFLVSLFWCPVVPGLVVFVIWTSIH